jgi:hypothetical protein
MAADRGESPLDDPALGQDFDANGDLIAWITKIMRLGRAAVCGHPEQIFHRRWP